MKKTDIIYFVLILLFVVGVYVWYSQKQSGGPSGTPLVAELSPGQYVTAEYGFSFAYSTDYFLEEVKESLPESVVQRIMLIHKADLETRENSEGPTAISVDISEVAEGVTLSEAAQNSPGSNFVLATGDILSATLSGKEAIYYRWSGLYEGETVHVLHNGKLLSFTVTFIAPEDPIAAEYKRILDSTVFN